MSRPPASVPERTWIGPERQDDALALEFTRTLSVPRAVGRLLVSRGFVTPDEVELFLRPRLSGLSEPGRLPDMDLAVRRIFQALDGHEKIVVFGDYDVDGITSTTLLYNVLRQLGAEAACYIPDRIDEGYGLSPDALANCLRQHAPRLIVTVDCGTGSVEAVRQATAVGVDVVVTDHHHVGDEIAPAAAVVNPRRSEDTDLAQLAGVGVAFKLCHALVKAARDQGRAIGNLDLRPMLELVAVGTVADLVPLTGENRTLVRHGLGFLENSASTGLEALKKVAGVAAPVTSYHVGFLLGPRLNAAGRLGTALEALQLLLAEDPSRAEELAKRLDEANRDRQALEAKTFQEACEVFRKHYGDDVPHAIVVEGDAWHPGVVGIVASRLTQLYHRPSVVLGGVEGGSFKGSCRSIKGFHMVEGLDACSRHLVKYGGHAMAAGLELVPAELTAFREAFNAEAKSRLSEEDLVPSVRVDAEISLSEASRELVAGLSELQPFGIGNATPVWCVRDVRLASDVRIMKERHIKFTVVQGGASSEVVGWNMADRVIPQGNIDLAFKIGLNEFRGRTTVQLTLVDVRPSSP